MPTTTEPATATTVATTLANTEVTPEQTSETTTRPKRSRRSDEDLLNASVKSLSTVECARLIKLLSDKVNTQEQQIRQYQENCKAAYEKVRLYEDALKEQKVRYDAILRFISQTVSVCNTTVNLAIKKEGNVND